MSVEFVAVAVAPSQFPKDQLPEIAFVGRSNVGKSSLLNALLLRGAKAKKDLTPLERGNLARTSRTPGRTQGVNFYRIDGRLYFVDLPGYGYARVPERARVRWKKLAESYLLGRSPLRLVVLLVDIRHGPTALDEQMKSWLAVQRQPYVVVATKADKLKRVERLRALRSIGKSFHPVLPFSAKTGEGVASVWSEIRKALET